ncbi:MAG TPA: histidine phosphatase family protein [Frankiaceae bacterium]|nr:histidine phosphatase family protein [Frankiaceae bacterium]
MSLLLLVRHGQAALGAYVGTHEGGAADPGSLTELGRRQAELSGAALVERGMWPDRVIAGMPRRQRETGELLRAAWGQDAPVAESDARWDEYDGSALLAAYPPEQAGAEDAEQSKARFFQQVLDESLSQWMADPTPRGSLPAWSDFVAGPRGAVADLAIDLGRGGTAVVATSAGVISCVVADLLGLTPDALLGIHRIVVNASITSVILGSRGRHLLTFNEHGHLQQAGLDVVTYR